MGENRQYEHEYKVQAVKLAKEIGIERAGNNPHCYVRSLRDVTNNWTTWKRLLRADELTISSGTWTPTLSSREGTSSTYSIYYRYAMYYRINNLVYISFHMKANISNQGSNYACVRGLPFTAANNMNGQGLAIHECFGGIDQYPASANIGDSTSTIFVQNAGGECSLQWRTDDTWIGFSE